MYAIELYVPKFDNDCKAIGSEHWQSLEGQIIDHFGGFTRHAAVGRWGKQSEEIYVYCILSETFGSVKRDCLDQIDYYVKVHWRQESMLWTITETAEINYV